jgi:DNA-binding transcriptional LysR family regulator
LKIKRLEDGLGRRLLDRTPRSVRLSAEGSAFLDPARALVAAHQNALGSFIIEQQRRVVIGISQHVVGAELPLVLKRMNSAEPKSVVELRVSDSRDVLDDFDRGLLDAAIVLQHDDRRLDRGRNHSSVPDGEIILEEKFGWMAAPDFEHRAGEKLRLAAQAEPCSVRSMAIKALDQAGIPWTEVFVGGGIATIGAAVSAGLAVAALGRRVAPLGTIDVGPQLELPPLPSRNVMLHSRLTDPQPRRTLMTLCAAIRSTAN